MSIQRSKSAPHIVAAPVTTALPRSTSHQQLQNSTRGYTPRTDREDPFNLAGFFPAPLVEEGEEWRWLHTQSSEADDSGDQVETPSGIFGQAEDRNTQEAIEGEDKLGVLALGQWRKSDGTDGPDIGLLSPYREVVDEESLYLAVSTSLRETAGSGPRAAAESGSLGSSALFFPASGGAEIESREGD